jgi:threonine synthase
MPTDPTPTPTTLTLGEGHTPLIRSRWLGPRLGVRDLRFKLEHLNPSGSYKDRFAARFVGNHLAAGYPFVLATSSGNTGAALATYAAAAGLRSRRGARGETRPDPRPRGGCCTCPWNA